MIFAETGKGRIFIIQDFNLERMKQGDPFIMGDVVICYEEGTKEEIAEKLKTQGFFPYLFRGYQADDRDKEPELIAVVKKPVQP